MSEFGDNVECNTHGASEGALLCQHLIGGEKRGFNLGYDPDIPYNLCPDAWCNECEKMLDAEGEWNDRAVKLSGIRLVCSHCYEVIRESNWLQDDEVFHKLIRSSFSYLDSRQKDFINKYKVDKHDHWDWYQETGKLVFSHKGKPQVEADIHFSGTFSNKSNTWMWAWANASLAEKVKASSRKVKATGEELGLKQLVAGRWTATEVDGWEMTSVLAKKLKAIGAYRAPVDNGFCYMVVTKAKWVNKNKVIALFSE